MSAERVFNIKGTSFKLAGAYVQVRDKAPDAELINTELQKVKLSDFNGKVRVLASLPSLETSVCSNETRTFNEIASELGDQAKIITVSVDLPFAQKRWCGASGTDRVTVLSDHKDVSFGRNYGVLVEEQRILSRAVFIVDKEGIIRHIELVDEISKEPDYDTIKGVVRELQ
ncbi:thiol peroxidase [Candidatus Saccharibacteria bacterium]|nr:thiol peroxidase [Candidatus Saccharibacteria bacterium]NIV71223.1 thiol peroxidase [Calditrichia bacterium]NIV97670.1 thiol peroxidase [Candidatus Saccharibacteria bacterium]NIW77976.1 thiol peroxidase [Calditrichia bacterium]